nr:type II secretion system F family protein [Microbacterium sp. ZXX196]
MWPAQAGSGRRVPAPRAIGRLLAASGYPGAAPRLLVGACAGTAAVAGATAWLLTGSPVLAGLAAMAGAAAPVAWLRARAGRLARRRRALWPDVCDLLVSAVRAGLTLPEAVSALGASAPAPLRAPFARFERDMRASGRFAPSADRLKEALADPLADRMIETLKMAREVGGTELVPVLRALSASVRADVAVRGEVESRQSWTKGAAVLGVVAPWVVLGMLSLRPEGAEAFATPTGVALILGGVVVSIVAYRAMLRIGRLPEPRRWFA